MIVELLSDLDFTKKKATFFLAFVLHFLLFEERLISEFILRFVRFSSFITKFIFHLTSFFFFVYIAFFICYCSFCLNCSFFRCCLLVFLFHYCTADMPFLTNSDFFDLVLRNLSTLVRIVVLFFAL